MIQKRTWVESEQRGIVLVQTTITEVRIFGLLVYRAED